MASLSKTRKICCKCALAVVTRGLTGRHVMYQLTIVSGRGELTQRPRPSGAGERLEMEWSIALVLASGYRYLRVLVYCVVYYLVSVSSLVEH